MRLPSARFWTFPLLFTLTFMKTEAQSSLEDSPSADSAYAVALREYHAYVAPEVGLYRGIQYVDYDYTIQKGQPFLGPDLIRDGSVWYGGIEYRHVSMEYDLVKEQLVIMDPFHVFKISLYMDLVDSFALGGNRYFRIRDSLAPSSMRAGYWDRVYQGRIVLLKREHKTRNENIVISSDNVRYFIDSSASYYIRRNNVYLPVNNKKELFDALKDRKRSEIRRVLRKSGLPWRDNKEELLRRVAAWYDGIKH
ncbi:MAG TPA: hypothetical protein VL978_10745 [Puia sp.]|nr:hypothetical protein [Puia sp.]